MEFVFETEYGRKEMTAMARALRKTIRKKHSRRSHIFGWIVMVIALLLILPTGDKAFTLDLKTMINLSVIVALFLVLVFEDRLNGYIAGKRMLNGTEKSKATFRDDGYRSETEMGSTEWQYDKIGSVAEAKDYFVFVFSPSHAQVYDKHHLTGGTVETFRQFIQDKTGKEIVSVR